MKRIGKSREALISAIGLFHDVPTSWVYDSKAIDQAHPVLNSLVKAQYLKREKENGIIYFLVDEKGKQSVRDVFLRQQWANRKNPRVHEMYKFVYTLHELNKSLDDVVYISLNYRLNINEKDYIIPDVFVEYEEVIDCLEADTSSEPLETIIAKVETYIRYAKIFALKDDRKIRITFMFAKDIRAKQLEKHPIKDLPDNLEIYSVTTDDFSKFKPRKLDLSLSYNNHITDQNDLFEDKIASNVNVSLDDLGTY
jgi:Replication-relaxation